MSQNRQRTRAKGSNPKKEITLMTLLAHESTADSRKLLKQYGKEDAVNIPDLELKLAELYFETQDKIALENKLAEIHPHKDWLLKYIKPIEVKAEEIKIEPIKEEVKSNCEGNPNCGCQKMSNACGCNHSSFSGVEDKKPQIHLQRNDYVGIIGLVAVIGLAFYVIKNK